MSHSILVPLTGLFLLLSTALNATGQELNLYIWSEYIPDEVVNDFTKTTGIKVRISTYDSNEAMYAKIKLVGASYDLIVPSTYFVGLMRSQGMLQKIDKKKLTNFALLDKKFVGLPFDPDNDYSIPYMWGSTSLIVNTRALKGVSVTSYADLWKPELKGRLILPNDLREVLGIGLKVMGFSINETDPAHLEKAYEKLTHLMPQVRVFDADSPKQALLSGEVAAGVVWNGEAYIANGEDPDIVYIYPPEGYSLWMDSFCIPRDATNVEAAYLFLNYMLRPEISAWISKETGYSSPNAGAREQLEDELKNNPIIYPGDKDVERGEFLGYLDDATRKLYEKYWVKLKSR
ncbi:MAG: spermidine/putrescine ABC transporter substrate-binding protein PotD [Deltaproteobacteria bacterium]|nr:MAG: spermidine/putrescine ABC transporter substrate-binding protein PotD [Deltaproteobacteria bacterium]